MQRQVALFVLAGSMLAASLGAQSPRPGQSSPPVPYDDPGACPFEGCVYRQWTANDTVVVRTEAMAVSPVAYTLKKGERVDAVTGIVRTLKAGRVEFRKAVDLSVFLDGAWSKIHVEPGQPLYVLTYHGEGDFKAWFQGTMYEHLDGATFYNAVCDTDPSRCLGRIVEPTQWAWWVQVKNKSGQVGWTNQPQKFDGKDALGSTK